MNKLDEVFTIDNIWDHDKSPLKPTNLKIQIENQIE